MAGLATERRIVIAASPTKRQPLAALVTAIQNSVLTEETSARRRATRRGMAPPRDPGDVAGRRGGRLDRARQPGHFRPGGEPGRVGVAAQDARQIARMLEQHREDAFYPEGFDAVARAGYAEGADELLLQPEHRAGYRRGFRVALAERSGVQALADFVVALAGKAA